MGRETILNTYTTGAESRVPVKSGGTASSAEATASPSIGQDMDPIHDIRNVLVGAFVRWEDLIYSSQQRSASLSRKLRPPLRDKLPWGMPSVNSSKGTAALEELRDDLARLRQQEGGSRQRTVVSGDSQDIVQELHSPKRGERSVVVVQYEPGMTPDGRVVPGSSYRYSRKYEGDQEVYTVTSGIETATIIYREGDGNGTPASADVTLSRNPGNGKKVFFGTVHIQENP